MNHRSKILNVGIIFMGIILIMLAQVTPAEEVAEVAAEEVAKEAAEEVAKDYFQEEAPHKIHLIAGKSQVIQFEEDVVRTSINDPEIASIVLVNPREILVNGKAPGVTTLIAWNEEGKRAIFDVEVDIDTSRLAKLIQKVVEGEEIQVHATNDRIVLSGEVERSTSVTKAGDIAEAYLPEVVNLLKVKQSKQILLQVRFAEVDRTAKKELGMDLLSQGGRFALHSYAGKTMTPSPLDIYPGPPPKITSLPPATDLYLELWIKHWFTLAPVIRALKERGLLRIIAEPNLIALDGNEASFLAGGEIPIPVSAGDGDISIEWKEYGVRLTFTPTTTDSDSIKLELEPEVSSLDYSHGVKAAGFDIPGLITRKTQTVVELGDGESLIIGGLIHQETNKTSSKIPFLGDLPLLGKLFTSERYQRGETELLVVVTPILIEPEDIKAAKRPRLSSDLPPSLEAKGPPYRDSRAERFKDFLDGKEVMPVIPEAEVEDEESLFYRQPIKYLFEDLYEWMEFKGEEARPRERVLSEREVKMLKKLPPKYRLIRQYYYGGF